MRIKFLPCVLALSAVVASVQVAYPQGPPPLPAPHTVEPGETHTNVDGVEVTNDGDSGGDMTINPKSGKTSSNTTVEVEGGAEGSVKGIDTGDTVDIKHNGGHVTIEGTGGTVNVTAGGAQATVTNTNPANGNPPGPNITIQYTGGTVSVPPGQTVNIP